MRNAFSQEITKLAALNDRIVLLSGDIGNRLFDPFKEKFPERFYNCGVAEANMTGMAAGMALCGLLPVTYTISAFNTVRCLEQIRLDVCYHRLPVVIVGVGAGLSYAALNTTHHALEEIAFMRNLPNMTVLCPGDSLEVRCALRAAVEWGGPVYIRMGKKNEPVVHREVPPFQIGKCIVLREGTDVCLVSTGTMLPAAIATAAQLGSKNISAKVVSMHTVKPLDEEFLQTAFYSSFSSVVTLEEHSRMGGLGGSIAEWLSEKPGTKARLLRFGTPDRFLYEAGGQHYARKSCGLLPEQIAEKVMTFLSAFS